MKTQANSHRQSSLKQMNPAALAIGAACLTLSLIISTTARADWGGGGFDGYSGNDGSQGGYSNDNASSGGNSQSSDSNNSGPLSMEQGLESRGTPGLIDSYARGEAAMAMEQALEESGVPGLIDQYAEGVVRELNREGKFINLAPPFVQNVVHLALSVTPIVTLRDGRVVALPPTPVTTQNIQDTLNQAANKALGPGNYRGVRGQ
jgi:hypothetical protein